MMGIPESEPRSVSAALHNEVVQGITDELRQSQADLAAAQAVIEQVRAVRDNIFSSGANKQLDAILSQSSPSALAAHDAEVAAKALEDAADDVVENGIQMNGSKARWTTQHSLRFRAQALRDGQAKSDQCV